MILQTSTVSEFNAIFEHLVNMVEIKFITDSTDPDANWPSVDMLLDLAEN
jgi:hypothetical protein